MKDKDKMLAVVYGIDISRSSWERLKRGIS